MKLFLENPMSNRLVLQLLFPPLTADLTNAVVRVSVEDVGEADAPAQVFAQKDYANISVTRDSGRTMLELDLPDLREAIHPAIRVHVDTTGSNRIEVGDFLNPAIVDVPDQDRGIVPIALIQIR
jgi:hypothetical protein